MAKAALRKAATKANPVAISPRVPRPVANPTAPTTAKTNPTSWANFSGGVGSFSLTGASRADAAIRRASPTITQAGVVLVATFGALAVVPVGAFTQFAVVMATGVALDTLLVRPFLMPVLMTGALRHPGPRPRTPLGPRGRRRATVRA